ncbi:MAG TPA: hypothetical protein VE619_03450, partial [Nitrososphaeraceae archaeon]|nr:hypothetical protein [Nitrososphaeraceae archaeon]
ILSLLLSYRVIKLLRIVLISITTILLGSIITDLNFNNNNNKAYAHFFGSTKNIGDYQVVFQPFPFVPFAKDNSTTLNFSVLDKNNSNINNIYAALIVKEKNTGKMVGEVPFKFYEFSDITFRHPFQNVGNYVLTFEARINGDPKYQFDPLVANFDISVSNLHQVILPFSQLMLYYVIPSTATTAALVVYFQVRQVNTKKKSMG